MKYLKLRTLISTNNFDWVSSTIIAAVLSNYTFNESHASLAEIEISGATTLSTARLVNKSVTLDGWAASQAVTLPVVPLGGPYTVVLMVDTNGQSSGIYPLVAYTGANALTTTTNGDVLIRPENSLVLGVGKWFRF